MCWWLLADAGCREEDCPLLSALAVIPDPPPARRVLSDATTCPIPRRNPHVVDEIYPEQARSPHPLVAHCLLGPFASGSAPLGGEPCSVPALQKFGETVRAQESLKADRLWQVQAAAEVVSARPSCLSCGCPH